MKIKKEDFLYFEKRFKENNIFWQRFNKKIPDFKNKKILSIGCGHGALCIDMAIKGAEKVIGIDIDCEDKICARKFKNQP